MIRIPASLKAQFNDFLARNKVPQRYQYQYLKWLRYYLDFCHKYAFDASAPGRLPRFIGKLEEKKQTRSQQRQAAEAICMYYDLVGSEPENQSPELIKVASKSGSVKEADDAYGSAPQRSEIQKRAGRLDSAKDEPVHVGAKGSWESAYRQLSNKIKVRHYNPRP